MKIEIIGKSARMCGEEVLRPGRVYDVPEEFGQKLVKEQKALAVVADAVPVAEPPSTAEEAPTTSRKKSR